MNGWVDIFVKRRKILWILNELGENLIWLWKFKFWFVSVIYEGLWKKRENNFK